MAKAAGGDLLGSKGRFGSRKAGVFRWFHVPKSGSVVVVPCVEGWVAYEAHFTGGRYVRCVGEDCFGCAAELPVYSRMVLGVYVEGKVGKWAIELTEGAGVEVQEVYDRRGRVGLVPLRVSRKVQGNRSEVQVLELGTPELADREVVAGSELVAWLRQQAFWRGEKVSEVVRSNS